MKINILTYNNGVGIVTDAILLKNLIHKNISTQVEVKFVNEQILETADIGIWIQNYDINLLNLYKKNIFFINEEWAGPLELSNLYLFDYVICKSKYSEQLLSPYYNVIYIPFISTNYYNPSMPKSDSFLHFAGRSIQKNTELVLSLKNKLTLIDPYNRYQVDKNVNHIKTYQSFNEISQLLNSHNIHICCSLYESWGHYLFEGLSTGAEIICSDIPVFREQLDPDLVHFIPTNESIDNSYIYCNNIQNLYKFRKSFFVDEKLFLNKITNFESKGKHKQRIDLYNQIMTKNTKKLLHFFKNI